jgi:hypothetical protein
MSLISTGSISLDSTFKGTPGDKENFWVQLMMKKYRQGDRKI